MALSYYSPWGDSFQQQIIDSDAAILADDPELQALLHGYAFFNPNDFFFSDQNGNNTLLSDDFTNGLLLPFHNNLNSLPQNPIFPHQEVEFEPFHHPPKRQKCCDSDQIHSSFFPPNPCLADYLPPPFLDFPAAGYSNGSCESARSEASPAGNLSAHSAAARQRRWRITEKTQELGKLVPGGQKMNTAEMLQSAYKYIKFLQAQVSLLESVNGLNNKEVAEAPFVEGEEMLQILLQSPLIQEKLYSSENCLVPQKFVDEKTVKSNSFSVADSKKER